MAGYKYSLAQVKVSISVGGTTKSFGGQGSMIGSITLSRKNDRFSAEGDATGGFVINETLDATGTCTISIKQFAPLVSTLTNLFNNYDTYYGGAKWDSVNSSLETNNTVFDISSNLEDNDAMSISVYYGTRLIASCKGCYLNMPELSLEEENGSRDFSIECGQVNFELLDATQANKITVKVA